MDSRYPLKEKRVYWSEARFGHFIKNENIIEF